MKKCVYVWFLCLISSAYCWSQPSSAKNKNVRVGVVKTDNTLPVNNRSQLTPIGSATMSSLTENVLFATNEDCYLYINEELKGAVLKSSFQYIKLAPGNHTYKAKSKATLDEFQDTFSVTEGKPNEIFIDLLYFIDEKNARRDILRTGSTVIFQPTQVLTETINTLTSNMVSIRGGNFVMGNNKAPFADEIEHIVTINPVLFSKYEVTQRQWEAIMGNNPSLNKGCAACPVDNVSWEEVMRFIRKLNIISSKKFRLPTEAEWEYMARMGGKTEIDTAGGQEAYIKKTAWYSGNADKRTHPVGSKQPNVAKIFDLMGNVSEWCLDWYGSYYYKEDFNQFNPEGPPLGKEKIVRGGNFKDFVGDRFRPSFRNRRNPIDKSGEVGFRLVLEMF